MTKNEMARQIVKQLFNLDTLPAADNVNVLKQARAKKWIVEDRYEMALAAEDAQSCGPTTPDQIERATKAAAKQMKTSKPKLDIVVQIRSDHGLEHVEAEAAYEAARERVSAEMRNDGELLGFTIRDLMDEVRAFEKDTASHERTGENARAYRATMDKVGREIAMLTTNATTNASKMLDAVTPRTIVRAFYNALLHADRSPKAEQSPKAERKGTGKFRLVREFMSGQITSDHDSNGAAINVRDNEIAAEKTFNGRRPHEHHIYEVTA